MREFRTYGSVRGVRSNAHPYRDRNYSADFLVVRPQNFPRTARRSAGAGLTALNLSSSDMFSPTHVSLRAL